MYSVVPSDDYYNLENKCLRSCSLQKKCDAVEVENSLYDERFFQVDADRRDILSYLQMLLMQKGVFLHHSAADIKQNSMKKAHILSHIYV